MCGDRVNSVYLGQYHGCWCPGSLRRQDISSHDIDYIEYVGPSRIRGSVSSPCVKSMWSNDIKCKYMFMFPLKNLARKGLIVCMVLSDHFCPHKYSSQKATPHPWLWNMWYLLWHFLWCRGQVYGLSLSPLYVCDIIFSHHKYALVN